jgi:mannose-6-phosphate isomerase-like protein (cupin superfamily)
MVQDETGVADFIQWMEGRSFPSPNVDYDNLFTSDLPSTEAVMSALVWAKKGLEEEVHTQCNEFVVILDGHCDMFMNGQKTHYEKGDIIRIPPHVPHYAVITSEQPMMAIVQRQLIAA